MKFQNVILSILVVLLLFGCTSQNSSLAVRAPRTQPSAPAPSPSIDVESLNSNPVFFDSNGWQIRSYVYSPSVPRPTKAILLLPALGHTMEDYPLTLVARLHQEIPNAVIMTIDMRGSGESVNLGTYEDFTSNDLVNMKDDISGAKRYVSQNYPSVSEYYIIGADMGASAAILAAEGDPSISKLVIISPYESDSINLKSIVRTYEKPVLFVGSSDIEALAQFSRSSVKVVKTYSAALGTDIFGSESRSEDKLEMVITNFLK
ncbi:MAG: hypothetical protein ACP5N9_00280 [Candidatus Bilamarchaeum sp.]